MPAQVSAFKDAPIPAAAGIGLRAEHYRDLCAELPAVGWLEVHSENYFGAGGAPHHYLARLRRHYPLSFHGVGMSIGSADRPDAAHLARLKELIGEYSPGLVSEHLSWSSIDGEFINDLLPLPYTGESLRHLVEQVDFVQHTLGCKILLENASTYLQYEESEIPEWEFINSVAQKSGCGILLDVNNVFVNARNHGFDPFQYLERIDTRHVGEMHLAGHSVKNFGATEVRIDTHNREVSDDVWRLYGHALAHHGATPTLIEWDADLPPLAVLLGEAAAAQSMLEQHHARAA
ncbi:MAG: DUF692 domain-containing protein [Gammaproteobacteria bacterium]|nr:DUF692 domain-containing protein [Gammaproteobacteria bacterium]MDD9799387.1 DUF692 domain-containing protein [Gammaproteobacteria bacterium]MDD9815515.1 DUF692 domain-containing protein [Gammaproteobacteria bacterium]MDD9850545.1 DUF692 domain-containing protein [Gammaproteobacteria bacterium]MDD9870484.1 DUF692 domain-containing protein [Gammaproteobacteria bacterium]